MALVHTIGISILDYVGNRKSMPIYVPASVALGTVQTELNTYLPQLDAVIDGKIVSAEIRMALTLPGGMKGSPTSGHTVREGALNKYAAAATAFSWSNYVPSWKEAGFSLDSVLTSGIYGTAEGGLIVFASDEDGNALTSFIAGRRTFRK